MLRPNRNRRSESSAQRQNRLDRDRSNAAARLAIEEPAARAAQREARLARQRRNASVRFGNETPAQTLCYKGRLARQREYDHARRNRTRRNWNANPEANSQGNPLHLVAFLDDQSKLRFGVPEEVYLGPMDVVCRNCGALHFRDDARRQHRKASFLECCMFRRDGSCPIQSCSRSLRQLQLHVLAAELRRKAF